jgi:eukaryotic-like serine/threonine-protein kinase
MTGVTVSHYKILEKLGEGGMGIVYKAHDIKLDRTVALKFLPPHLTQSEEDKQRFIREAKAAAALNHPHICTIYSVEEHDDTQFISMEYIDGVTLREKLEIGNLKSETPATDNRQLTTIIDYALQIAEALAEAHEKGIVHRDIKPENIMVDSKNRIKVMDFGLARIAGSLNLTQTGGTVGTILYMSPEQVRGELVDHRTDIWSLGVVMYEMLTGTLPFKGEYEHAVSYRILNEDPGHNPELLSQVGSDYRTVLLKFLEKEPNNRYQSSAEVLTVLQKLRVKSSPSSGTAGDSEPPTQRIAVLPVVNISPEIQDEYFADGMTEEIISMLSKIGDLRVIARTTSMQYKNTVKSIGEIGKQLKVDSLLEGSVRKSNDNIRISIQLIDAKTETTIWSDSYDRTLQDIFAIQRDIAHRVAEALKIKLLPGEETQIEKDRTDNIDSYTLYLKGKFHWNKFMYEDILKSIDYYERAIELDPKFALGYSGLANSYSVLGLDFDYPGKTFEKSRAAAQHAIEMDPLLPEALVSLGVVMFFYDRDYVNAEQKFRRAIELNQSYAEAHELYAYFLSAMGRHAEAFNEIQYAINLDPLSLIINKDLGSYYYWARQYEKAIDQFHKTIEMEPRFFVTYGELGWAYSGLGMQKEALDAFAKAVEISGGARSVDIAGMGYMYAQIGEGEKAHDILSDLLNQSTQRFIGPEDIALVYAALGDMDSAFTYLEKALDKHGFYMCFLKVDHRFDILRNDLRFDEIVEKMGTSRCTTPS